MVTLDAQDTLKDACQLLSRHKFKKVPVVSGGRVVGMVNRSDVIRYAMESCLEAERPQEAQGGPRLKLAGVRACVPRIATDVLPAHLRASVSAKTALRGGAAGVVPCRETS